MLIIARQTVQGRDLPISKTLIPPQPSAAAARLARPGLPVPRFNLSLAVLKHDEALRLKKWLAISYLESRGYYSESTGVSDGAGA
eukprot:752049-Hanusia_phi.AAC.2